MKMFINLLKTLLFKEHYSFINGVLRGRECKGQREWERQRRDCEYNPSGLNSSMTVIISKSNYLIHVGCPLADTNVLSFQKEMFGLQEKL